MFADYRAQVLEDYRKKKDRNELSLNLTLSTPAKLRNECLAVLDARYSAKDMKTLKLFFGDRDSDADYEHAIKKFDIDKFRPLNNLLSNNTLGTDEKNIELLAWLIDFHPRPYHPLFFKREQEVITAVSAPENLSEEPGKKPREEEMIRLLPGEVSVITEIRQQLKKSLFATQKRSVFLLLILVITGAGAYLMLSNFLAPQKCMYWTGDDYRPISCNEKIEDTHLLALDAAKVENFKRITLTDTITRNSLGSIWYSKINNKLEFFTSDGVHPVHNERQLKPVTEYIIDKYLSGDNKSSKR